jgi:hypothetical protein
MFRGINPGYLVHGLPILSGFPRRADRRGGYGTLRVSALTRTRGRPPSPGRGRRVGGLSAELNWTERKRGRGRERTRPRSAVSVTVLCGLGGLASRRTQRLLQRRPIERVRAERSLIRHDHAEAEAVREGFGEPFPAPPRGRLGSSEQLLRGAPVARAANRLPQARNLHENGATVDGPFFFVHSTGLARWWIRALCPGPSSWKIRTRSWSP